MTRLYTFATILFLLFCCPSIAVNAQSPDRAQMEREMTSLRERLKEIEKQYILPAPEDSAAFASFLQQPGTGIMRLLPREKYDGFLAMRGGGAYYSFTRLTNEYGYGSDIELAQDSLSVGFAGADFGVLTMLGDVELDEVKPELPAVEYLFAFNTPLKESDARIQQRRVSMGFTVNEVAYKNRFPARVNNTYVVRSVDYGTSDVLVAFRVVRRDADGSLIIVWKMLKKFPVPQLERSNAVAASN
ncbi:MAG: hypothetical protein QOJ02_361 [Acidobacteriota bacterium]|jgi:hypothetical protein|nr:hypothetical protein [Acidobacteriota bacterium]